MPTQERGRPHRGSTPPIRAMKAGRSMSLVDLTAPFAAVAHVLHATPRPTPYPRRPSGAHRATPTTRTENLASHLIEKANQR